MAVKNVEEYISKHPQWESEIRELQEMILSTGLEENIKWGAPVYSFKGKNVVGIGAFKNHYGLWFFNGALLKENTNLLVNAQENKTKALRQIRLEKDEALKVSVLLPYVKEAIQNQKKGKEIKPDTSKKKTIIPPELSEAMAQDEELKKYFGTLTPGKQREYAAYISEAKKAANRLLFL